MPGTFIFKPIEAYFKNNKDMPNEFHPYCKFILGDNTMKSQAAEGGGLNPHWNDAFILTQDNESFCKIKVKCKGDEKSKGIGTVEVSLAEIQEHQELAKWYNIVDQDKIRGQLLLEVEYNPHNFDGDIYDADIQSSDVRVDDNVNVVGYDLCSPETQKLPIKKKKARDFGTNTELH